MKRERRSEGWFSKHWRPAMAWSYLAICLWDFLIAPLFFAWFSQKTGTPMISWKPLTLAEGGMYHMAMGAIVGVTAWSRGKENLAKLDLIKPNGDNSNG